MIKSRIYEYLKQYLGEYLYGLQEDQLEVAVLSGHLNFTNANFKPSKVNELFLTLGLPIHLKAGFIGKLQVKYHYMSMLSNPIEVTVDDLFLILGPVLMPAVEPAHDRLETFASDEELSEDETFRRLGAGKTTHMSSDSESDEELIPEDFGVGGNKAVHTHHKHPPLIAPPMRARTPNRTNPGRAISTQVREESKPKLPPKASKTSTLGAYIQSVLKRLTLTVNSLHIRYEDDIYPFQSPFSCGVCLESFTVKTDSVETVFPHIDSPEQLKKPARKEATCKDCTVKNLAVYMNPLSGMLIPTSLWEATLSSPIGIFDALPAYEIRDLILQESAEKFAGSPHNFLSPVSLQCFLTLEEKGVSAALPLPPLTIRLTSAMAESANSFLDYFVNVQLWGHMRRYRPYERINTSPHEDNEPKWLTAKRKKVVRKWFIHAFRFIRYKKKLIQLVKDRKRRMDRERERKSRKQRYARGASDMVEELPLVENVAPAPAVQAKSPFRFLAAKPRIIPGTTGIDLSAAVNEYNKRILNSSTSHEERKPAVLPTAAHHGRDFPSFVVGTDLQIRAENVIFQLCDEEKDIEACFESNRFGLNLKIDKQKLLGELNIVEITADVRESKSPLLQLLKVGKREIAKEEIVKQGLFAKPTRRVTVTHPSETAVSITFSYSPNAFRLPGEPHPTENMYESRGSISSFRISYSHQALGSLAYLHTAFSKDFSVSKKRSLGTDLVKRLKTLSKRLQRLAKDLDSRFEPISYEVNYAVGAATVVLVDRKGGQLCEVTLPPHALECVKDEQVTRVGVMGVAVTVRNSLTVFLSFFTVKARQNLKNALGDRFGCVEAWARAVLVRN